MSTDRPYEGTAYDHDAHMGIRKVVPEVRDPRPLGALHDLAPAERSTGKYPGGGWWFLPDGTGWNALTGEVRPPEHVRPEEKNP